MKENPPKFSPFACRNLFSAPINPSLFIIPQDKERGPMRAYEHRVSALVRSPGLKMERTRLTFISKLILTGIQNLVKG